MKIPAQADLQRWSDEVARDPRSLAFLPLARAYRRQGLRDAAMQLCMRGLDVYPEHVEAHALIALLHLEAGAVQKAADEWSIVLRYDPDNFEALRGMGFWYFERDQLSRARQLLERAAQQRPEDVAVREALLELGTRQELHGGAAPHPPVAPHAPEVAPTAADLAAGTSTRSVPAPTAAPPAEPAARPWAELIETEPVDDEAMLEELKTFAATPQAAAEGTTTRRADAAPPNSGRSAVRPRADESSPRTMSDPAQLFDELLATAPVLGALLVDGSGLVQAGRLMASASGDASTLGAVLGDAVVEAKRTAAHLGLGHWRGNLVETEHALLHVRPVDDSNSLVIVAGRETPAGWLLRASAQAAQQATRFLREYA